MSVIDEVKQRTDIVEVVSRYVSLKKAGRNLSGLCPFHSEKHPSFFVYPEQQSWHCFGCNTGGDVFSFVMKKENMDFGETLHLLAERAGVTIPSKFEREGKKGEKERLYQINEAAAQYFHNLLLNSPDGEKARSYVASRGFTAKTIADFQLGFSLNSWESLKQYLLEKDYAESEMLNAGLIIEAEDGKTHDRFRNKLMFPILDIRGRVIGFGARVLDDSLPKYVNSPQTPLFDKSSSLYAVNLAAASIRQQEVAVIVEGYMDVITAHQNGFNNVVASMGTAVAEKQVGSLKRLTKNMILALDADVAGGEAMLRGVGYENTIGAEMRVVILPESKDPDDVIKDDVKIWQQLTADALPIVDYTFNMVTAKLDLTTARDKSLAADKLLPIIAEIKDNIRRDHYLRKLTKLIGASYNSVEASLKEYLARRRAQTPRQAVPTRMVHPIVSSPLEENCLALMLQHYELKGREDFPPEYFENSENREIFIAWQQADNLTELKEKLDESIHEYFDSLINISLPTNKVEERYADYNRRLKERYFKNLEAKRAEVFASEAESGGTGADLTKLKEEGIEPSVQLREIFTEKGRRRSETRR
ncbi:DNA primase [subsurface metagenome]